MPLGSDLYRVLGWLLACSASDDELRREPVAMVKTKCVSGVCVINAYIYYTLVPLKIYIYLSYYTLESLFLSQTVGPPCADIFFCWAPRRCTCVSRKCRTSSGISTRCHPSQDWVLVSGQILKLCAACAKRFNMKELERERERYLDIIISARYNFTIMYLQCEMCR